MIGEGRTSMRLPLGVTQRKVQGPKSENLQRVVSVQPAVCFIR